MANNRVIKQSPEPLLYRWDDMVLSFSATSQLHAHTHGAAELVVTLARPVTTQLKHHAVTATSVLIPPTIEHRNQYSDPLSAVFYLDVESYCYQDLTTRMVKQHSVYIGMPDEMSLQRALKKTYDNVPNITDCYTTVVKAFFARTSMRIQTLDTRIAATLKTIKTNPSKNTSVQALAEQVNISEDRLHHLFTSELGIPIHKYRIWMRLKHASKLYFEGRTLTFAAHEAGFSDAPHFSRTFSRMYGAPPSKLLAARRNSRTFFASS